MTRDTRADQYARATRMLGYALTLGDHAAWKAATAVWIVRLTSTERAALAFAALQSLNPEHATPVANAAIFGTVNEEGA